MTLDTISLYSTSLHRTKVADARSGKEVTIMAKKAKKAAKKTAKKKAAKK